MIILKHQVKLFILKFVIIIMIISKSREKKKLCFNKKK